MAAVARVAWRWVVVLAAFQMGPVPAEAGSWPSAANGVPVFADVSSLTAMGSPACCGEYGRYAPDSLTDCGGAGWFETSLSEVWTVDYRVRQMFDSSTSYEFGNPAWDAAGVYAPLSKLDFELDSPWHGLQIGVELPGWRAHFEWLMPMRQNIDGYMADYDWNIDEPRDDPTRLDSLTLSSERWSDGQMLELGTEFHLTDSFFGLPVELWPTAGFRFQRFDVAAFDITVLVPSLGPLPAYDGVDVITFNQQYYVGYFGGQFRGTVLAGRIPVDLALQVDGGPVAGYAIDHHLLRLGDRYTFDETRGAAWHIGVMAEAHVTHRFSVGFQADHTGIRTIGTHRLYNEPYDVDVSWDNGVIVKSQQTTATVFARYRF